MSLKKEIKKVTKLINKKGFIPFMEGSRIRFVMKDNIAYYPKHNLMMRGA